MTKGSIMRLSILIAAVVAACCVNQALAADKVVCYFTNWSQYAKGNGKFTASDVDPWVCTHILFAFAEVRPDSSIVLSDEWGDPPQIATLVGLKNINPNLKILVSVGGWSAGSKIFSDISCCSDSRRRFIWNAVGFMDQYGFDGFDIDWEYPGQREGSNPAWDKINYIDLLREMRQAFDSTGKYYLMTAAVSSQVEPSYNVREMVKYLDFINLMTYDFHSYMEGVTGQNAPMYYSPKEPSWMSDTNVHGSVSQWLNAGAPGNKLVMGVGLYGRSFKLADAANQNGLRAPSDGPGRAGPYTGGEGYMGYNEICEAQNNGGWWTVYDWDQQTPYTVNWDQWIGYDNVQSVEAKSGYAKDRGLGGIMVWSLDTDDFRGNCGQGYWPLMNAIRRVLGWF